MAANPKAPGPGFLDYFRLIPIYRRNPLQWLEEMRQYGGIVRLRVGTMLGHLLNRPEHIQHLLQHNYKNYRKSVFYRELEPLLGQGLVTSDGDFWLKQRRMIQPGFRRDRVSGFVQMFGQETEHMLSDWREHFKDDETFDLSAEMMKLTFRIIGKSLVSKDLAGDADEIGDAITVALHEIMHRAQRMIKAPRWLPTRRNRRAKNALSALDRLVQEIIEERRASEDGPDDLLTMLIAATNLEDGTGMDDRQLRDEMMTLLMAGHETTSNALTWTFYLLSQNPGHVDELRDELSSVLGGRTPNVEDIPKLERTRQILCESMRLFPPVWLIDRNAIEDDEIGGVHIPAGSLVGASQYIMHRHPDYWEDPTRFNPDRFQESEIAKRERFTYFPFGGGPRLCIGEHFAMLEATVILATIAQHVDLSYLKDSIETEPLVTLRPKHGLPVRLKYLRRPTGNLIR